MKINKEIVEEALLASLQDQHQVELIMEEIQRRSDAARRQSQNQADPNQGGNQGDKREVVVLICQENDLEAVRSLTERVSALAFQIDESEDHNRLPERLVCGGMIYNDSKKRPSAKLRNIVDACSSLSPSKHLNGFPKKIFTKEPATVIVSTNLPVAPNSPRSQGE